MKHQSMVASLLACALALTSTAVLAQGGGQGAGQRPQADRPAPRQQVDRAAQRSQDRADEMMQQKDQKKDRDQLQKQVPQGAASDTQQQQRSQMQEKIYGRELMSVEERNEYQEKLRNIDSDEERGKFIAQHREDMRLRAKEKGMTIEEIETEEAE